MDESGAVQGTRTENDEWGNHNFDPKSKKKDQVLTLEKKPSMSPKPQKKTFTPPKPKKEASPQQHSRKTNVLSYDNPVCGKERRDSNGNVLRGSTPDHPITLNVTRAEAAAGGKITVRGDGWEDIVSYPRWVRAGQKMSYFRSSGEQCWVTFSLSDRVTESLFVAAFFCLVIAALALLAVIVSIFWHPLFPYAIITLGVSIVLMILLIILEDRVEGAYDEEALRHR